MKINPVLYTDNEKKRVSVNKVQDNKIFTDKLSRNNHI